MALYGAETWTLRATDQKRLQSFEMRCWGRMEKISWTDHVRNEEVFLTWQERRVCDVAAWDGTHCRGPLGSGVRMALKSRIFPRSGFCCVRRNKEGNWNWEYRTGTGANWHFTWCLTTNCPPVGTSEPTESDACLTGSICDVYISPPHSTPCDSALCSIVQLQLYQRLIIRAL